MKRKSFDEMLKNWSIKRKLIISFGIVIVTTFILIVSLLVGLFIAETKVAGLFEGPTTSSFYVGDIRFGLVANQRAINRVIAVGDDVLVEEKANMQANIDLAIEAMEILNNTLISDENKALLVEMGKQFETEAEYRKELIALFDAHKYDEANAYDEEYYTPLVNEIRANADKLDQSIYAVGEEYAKDAEILVIVLVIIGAVLLIVITVIAVKLALRVTKTIAEPVAQIQMAALQLRQGDLAHADDITYESDDELGVLAKSMRESINILSDYVKNICENFDMVAEGNLTRSIDDVPDFDTFFKNLDVDIKLGELLYLEHIDTVKRDIHTDSFDIKAYFAVFDEKEDSGGVIVVLQDVTQQEMLENSRREFVANVSHELRTPLTTIRSYTETLIDGAAELPDTRDKFLNIIIARSE